MTGIIAGGGLPEGTGWRRWLKMLLRALFPNSKPGGRV